MSARRKPEPDRSEEKRKTRPSSGRARPDETKPAAGPLGKPHLNEPEKTPGAGSLPDPERPSDGDATTG